MVLCFSVKFSPGKGNFFRYKDEESSSEKCLQDFMSSCSRPDFVQAMHEPIAIVWSSPEPEPEPEPEDEEVVCGI